MPSSHRRWHDYEEEFLRYLKSVRIKNDVIAHWLCRTEVAIKVRWNDLKFRRTKPFKPGEIHQRRFEHHYNIDPSKVQGLDKDHFAVIEGRTRYPKSVVNAADSPRLLVSGEFQRKLGRKIVKGPWVGMPIYHLTLEERATCPSYCEHWNTCYGNNMHWARRHRIDDTFTLKLFLEVRELALKYPDGFVVRLHTLGDFVDPEYIEQWAKYLMSYSALHIFGYTAWKRDSKIGQIAGLMNQSSRCFIRFSGDAGPMGAETIWERGKGALQIYKENKMVGIGIVCPAQTGNTDCCATCGLCWHPAMKKKAIVFIAHGGR